MTAPKAPGHALRWVALGVALTVTVAGALGYAVTSEALEVTLFKRRPRLLHFGRPDRVGPCLLKETDDPTSDVLANLLDLDGDGWSEYRVMGYVDHSKPSCERRRFGVWFEAPMAECKGAADWCWAAPHPPQ